MKFLSTLICLVMSASIYSQECNEVSLQTRQVRAQDTDSNIPWELAKHYTYFNPDCQNRKILVLHLVGTYDNPSNNTLFPALAANNGFHSICLKYPNSTAAVTACSGSSALDCFNNFRKEIIEGGDYSPEVSVDITNSITNRFLKLLIYLDTSYPTEGWDNYYTSTTLHWNKIIVSGHSQGGGHAAYIAKTNEVKRCLLFASPNDYSSYFSAPAPWTSTVSLTSEGAYFGFGNLHDDVVNFSNQFEIWSELGMPNYGDSLDIDNALTFNSSHQLYTTTIGANANDNHSLMIRDENTPINGANAPVFEPVWEYMLGIDIGLGIAVQNQLNFSVYPNPANTSITVQSNENAFQSCKISILNLHGEEIISQNISSQMTSINIDLLPNGLYILKIASKTEVLLISKFSKLN